jgi:hypothetical protein
MKKSFKNHKNNEIKELHEFGRNFYVNLEKYECIKKNFKNHKNNETLYCI